MKTVKHLSVLLAVLLVVSLLVVGFVVNADEPAVITVTNEAEFAAAMVEANAAATIELANDITLTNGNTAMPGAFTGTFDGKGFAISGITNTLFAKVSGGTVKNVTVNGAIVASNRDAATITVRADSNAVIENVTSNVNITVSGNQNDLNAGGIVGYGKKVTLTKCTYAGTYTVENGGGGGFGGIVGYVNNDNAASTYTDCAFTGTIVVNGTQTGTLNLGAIVGRAKSGPIAIVRATNLGTFNLNNAACAYNFGGIAGTLEDAGTTISGAFVQDTIALGEGVNANRVVFIGNAANGIVASGAIKLPDNYLANDGEGLAAVFAHMPADAYVKVNADVTLPAGTPTFTKADFSGTLDGQNHTVSGLSHTLFKKINGGTVKNIAFEGELNYDASVDGKDPARKAATLAWDAANVTLENVSSAVNITTTAYDLNAGGIIGYANEATLTNCTYTGTYEATWTADNGAVGGIVGYIRTNSGTNVYTNCVFAGTLNVHGAVEGKDMFVGGIIGKHRQNDVQFVDVTNTGVINADVTAGRVFVGGFLGQNQDCASITMSGIFDGTINAPGATVDNFLANDTAGTANTDGCKLPVKFDEGTIGRGQGGFVIGTETYSAFISVRNSATEGKFDYRFVIAADQEVYADAENLNLILTFTKDGAVVKTLTKNIKADLDIYAKATAAGNTYIAAEGDLLTGIVITNVPAEAWDDVTVTVADGETAVAAGTVAAEDVTEVALPGTFVEATSYGFENHHPDLDNQAAWILNTGDDTTITDGLADGTLTAVVTLDGEAKEIVDFYNSNGWVRLNLESAGFPAITKGETYTVVLDLYNADGELVYYTAEFEVESAIFSTHSAQNITLPGIGLSKLTVDTSKIACEGISNWGDGAAERLFDGNTQSTKIGGGVNGTFSVSFSLTEAKAISFYTFTTGGDTASFGRNPATWVLYGKVGEEWVALDTVGVDGHCGLVRVNRTPFSYAVDTPTVCIDYKIEFTTTESAFQMNELELFASEYDYTEAVDIAEEFILWGDAIEDWHNDEKTPWLVSCIENETLYPDIFANEKFNEKYEWKISVNGEAAFTPAEQSCYDGGSWGYLRSNLGAAYSKYSEFDIFMIIVEKETGKVAYFYDIDTLHYGFLLDENKPDDVVAIAPEDITVTAGPDLDGSEGAKKAFDGLFNTKVCTGANGAENAIIATLANTTTLRGIGLANGGDNESYTGRTVLAFEIYVSADGTNWGEPVYATTGEGKDKGDYNTNFMEIYYGFEAPVDAKYVKVVVNNGELYQLSEIFLYTNNTLEEALTTVDSKVPVYYDRDITAGDFVIGLTVDSAGGHFNQTSIAQLTAEGAYAFVKEGDEYVRYNVSTLRTDRHCDIFFILDGFTPVAGTEYEIHFFFIGSESCSHPGGRLYLTGNAWKAL